MLLLFLIAEEVRGFTNTLSFTKRKKKNKRCDHANKLGHFDENIHVSFLRC